MKDSYMQKKTVPGILTGTAAFNITVLMNLLFFQLAYSIFDKRIAFNILASMELHQYF